MADEHFLEEPDTPDEIAEENERWEDPGFDTLEEKADDDALARRTAMRGVTFLHMNRLKV